MNNVPLFDISVLHIANRLYASFPVCIHLKTYDEIVNIPWQTNTPEELKALVFSETVFWLEENKFLSFSGHEGRLKIADDTAEPSSSFACVRLTAKGVNILKSPPASLKTRESFGDKLAKGLKDAVTKEATSKIAELGTEFVASLGSKQWI